MTPKEIDGMLEWREVLQACIANLERSHGPVFYGAWAAIYVALKNSLSQLEHELRYTELGGA